MNEIIPMKTELAIPGKLHENGLELRENLSFDEWASCGKFLQRAEKCLLWWIGDWLNYGERKYGEMYAQAIEETPNKYQTLRISKWVSSRVELFRRRNNLSWSHHQEVAQLEPDEQDYWLDKAESDNLSTRDLRCLIKSNPTPRQVASVEDSISSEFEDAYEHFKYQIVEAKKSKWKTTGKEQVLRHLQILTDLVHVGRKQ